MAERQEVARKKKTVTIDHLKDALKSGDLLRQSLVFLDYSSQKPSPEAIPFLRRGLRSKDPSVVRSAADALKKLGAAAEPALNDLFLAAYTTDGSGIPQAYPECLHAIVAIRPDDGDILELVTHWAGVTNWGITSAAMAALKKVGSPNAIKLLRRLHAFWYSELNKAQKKKADQFME